MNRNRQLASLGLLALVAGIWIAAGHNTSAAPKSAPPERKDAGSLAEFMHAKLGASEQILEGLVTENFDLIKEGADKLKKISSAEKWRISNDPSYRHHSAQFQQVTDRLLKAATDEKLDGAALEWMQATMSCVECHKFVRGAVLAKQ